MEQPVGVLVSIGDIGGGAVAQRPEPRAEIGQKSRGRATVDSDSDEEEEDESEAESSSNSGGDNSSVDDDESGGDGSTDGSDGESDAEWCAPTENRKHENARGVLARGAGSLRYGTEMQERRSGWGLGVYWRQMAKY